MADHNDEEGDWMVISEARDGVRPWEVVRGRIATVDEIDGDEKARKAGIFPCQAAVLFQSLDHSPGPSPALTEETFEVNWRAREPDGACFKSNSASRFEQCPSEHDIFADHRRPASNLSNSVGAKRAESTLRNQSSLIERLLPFGRSDSGKIIPFLQTRYKTFAGILD